MQYMKVDAETGLGHYNTCMRKIHLISRFMSHAQHDEFEDVPYILPTKPCGVIKQNAISKNILISFSVTVVTD